MNTMHDETETVDSHDLALYSRSDAPPPSVPRVLLRHAATPPPTNCQLGGGHLTSEKLALVQLACVRHIQLSLRHIHTRAGRHVDDTWIIYLCYKGYLRQHSTLNHAAHTKPSNARQPPKTTHQKITNHRHRGRKDIRSTINTVINTCKRDPETLTSHTPICPLYYCTQ